jgi:hypothetical protein
MTALRRTARQGGSERADISYMSYNRGMAREDGFAVLTPERKRSRSKRQAEERLAEADRRLASALTKTEIDSIADAAEHAAAIVAAPARPGTSPLTGSERPSREEVAAASRRTLARQFALRRELLKDTMTAADVAELLGTTRQTPHDRYKAKTLLAIRDGGKLLFPIWQFDPNGPDGVLNGLRDVLKALEAPMSELGQIAWFVAPKPQLQGRSPVETLPASGWAPAGAARPVRVRT